MFPGVKAVPRRPPRRSQVKYPSVNWHSIDLFKDVTPEQRETIDKMIERLEEFDDVQTVYTNMKPEEDAE